MVVFKTNADGSNADLVLQCDVTGMPTPTMTWYRRDDVVDVPVDASNVLSNGTLLVQNITEGEFASTAGVVYHCEATNTIGEPEFSATIRSRDITVYYACKQFIHLHCKELIISRCSFRWLYAS